MTSATASTTAWAIELQDVAVNLGGQPVLQDLSLSIPIGNFTVEGEGSYPSHHIFNSPGNKLRLAFGRGKPLNVNGNPFIYAINEAFLFRGSDHLS